MDIVDRLTELVGIPSVSGNEEAIANTIHAMVATARPRWPLERLGNNLVIGPVRTSAPKAGKPLVALVGHLDTVPAQGNAAAVVHDDAVWGVGSTDMKAGVAVMCDLIETLPDRELPYDLLFVFYDKEEVGFHENGLGVVLKEVPILSRVDLAFVLEPTAMNVEMGCNGHIVADVTFKGVSAHSARPWTGENAIHKAGAFITKIAAIETLDVRVGNATYRQTIQITEARGGIARNVIPDSFVVRLSHRFPPGRTIDQASAYIEGLVPNGASFAVRDSAPPGAVPEKNRVFDAFVASAKPEVRGKQGWTDVARLSMNGIDAVNYGPGVPELCHRADEHCPIGHLRGVRESLYRFLTT
jgi:succinyl-diaminopimelate desuccinylase